MMFYGRNYMNSRKSTVEDIEDLCIPTHPKKMSSYARVAVRIESDGTEVSREQKQETKVIQSSVMTVNRLMASELNVLLGSLKEKNRSAVVVDDQLNLAFADTLGYASPIRYTVYDPAKLVEKIAGHAMATHRKSQPIIVFNVSKDAKTQTNHPELFYIDHLLNAFFEEARFERYRKNTLLMFPVVLCRGYGYLPTVIAGKEHAVLMSIRLPERELVVHDSQAGWRDSLYPHCMRTLATKYELSYNHRYYSTQQDNQLCGSFVFLSIVAYLKTLNFDQLASLNLNLTDFKNKEHFFRSWNEIHNKMFASDDWQLVSAPSEEKDVIDHSSFSAAF